RTSHRDVPVSRRAGEGGAAARATREGDAGRLQSAGAPRARALRGEEAGSRRGRGRSRAGEDGPRAAPGGDPRAESEHPPGGGKEHYRGFARAARRAALAPADAAPPGAGKSDRAHARQRTALAARTVRGPPFAVIVPGCNAA